MPFKLGFALRQVFDRAVESSAPVLYATDVGGVLRYVLVLYPHLRRAFGLLYTLQGFVQLPTSYANEVFQCVQPVHPVRREAVDGTGSAANSCSAETESFQASHAFWSVT